MSVSLYMDQHIPDSITEGLRALGVDVVTAKEDSYSAATDLQILDRASSLGRLVFSFDQDFLIHATDRQRKGMSFRGIVSARPSRITIGQCIEQLHYLCATSEPDQFHNSVTFLPVW